MGEKESRYAQHPSRSREVLLDKDRVLTAETPLDGWKSLSESDLEIAHNVYGLKLMRHLESSDGSSDDLSKSFTSIRDQISREPGADEKDGVFTSQDDVAAAYGSMIVANIADPGEFLLKMSTDYASEHPTADQQSKDAFSSQSKELAAVLYGARYAEYAEQMEDLQLTSHEKEEVADLERNKAADKLILGKSHGIKRVIFDKMRGIANLATTIRHGGRNALAMANPKYIWAANSTKSAKRKHARMTKKLEESNPTTTFGRLIKKGRQRRADAYEQNVLKPRDERYKARREPIDERKKTAEGTRNERDANYQARIDHYQSRRQSAEARKALRKSMKQEGAGIFERRRALQEMSSEQLQRIGRAKCLESAAEQALQKATREQDKADTAQAKLESDITDFQKNAAEARTLSASLKSSADTLESTGIPDLEAQAADAGNKMNVLQTNGADLAEYREAEIAYNKIAAQLVHSRDELVKLRKNQEAQAKRAIEMRAKSINALRDLDRVKASATQAATRQARQQDTYNRRAGATQRTIDKSL